jgi:hypothetical protein
MKWRHLDCAKAAAESMGFKWVKGGNVRYFYGAGPECDYTIEFDGKRGINKKYNAGLKKSGNAYELLIDNSIQGAVISDTSTTGRLGGKTDQLVKDFRIEYGKKLVQKHARAKGYHYKFVGVNEKGRALIRLTT